MYRTTEHGHRNTPTNASGYTAYALTKLAEEAEHKATVYASKGMDTYAGIHDRTAKRLRAEAQTLTESTPEPIKEEFASVVIPPDAFGKSALAAD